MGIYWDNKEILPMAFRFFYNEYGEGESKKVLLVNGSLHRESGNYFEQFGTSKRYPRMIKLKKI